MLARAKSAAGRMLSLAARAPGVRVVAGLPRLLYYVVKCRTLRALTFAPPGHFYSPIPDIRSIPRDAPADDALPADIDLRESGQLSLLDEFARFHDGFTFPADPAPGYRYYYRNRFFGRGNAVVLYCFMRRFRPRRIVEVGGGFSSALMLDTDERFLGGATQMTFIEPDPARLLALLGGAEDARRRVVPRPVQEVPLDLFRELSENDILFIDSSHVVKFASDVARLIFEVLPALKPGVIIHFHDIGWPFEYPREWLLGGRAWNEAYFLRAFLQGNRDYEILFFNACLATRHNRELLEKLPLCDLNPGGGFWIRKRAPAFESR